MLSLSEFGQFLLITDDLTLGLMDGAGSEVFSLFRQLMHFASFFVQQKAQLFQIVVGGDTDSECSSVVVSRLSLRNHRSVAKRTNESRRSNWRGGVFTSFDMGEGCEDNLKREGDVCGVQMSKEREIHSRQGNEVHLFSTTMTKHREKRMFRDQKNFYLFKKQNFTHNKRKFKLNIKTS